MVKKIATAAVYIGDQQQAIEFWTKQIGFKVLTTACSGYILRCQ
jgi:hypothetical protein